MSIATEITRINNNIASAYTAANSKGATMPATQNSANLANCINSITTGGGGGSTYERPSDWLAIPTMDGTTDDVYILNGVGKDCLNKIYFKVSGSGTIDWGDGDTETFTNVTEATYSHEYDFNDLSSSSWTDHNNSRQALIHISGTRGAITYFSTASITYSYTNADNVTVNYSANISTDIYQISANVNRCDVGCSNNSGQPHSKLEVFDWQGTITNTNMSYMFHYCYSLQSIPQLNTSSVTDMSYMFNYCYSLQTIPHLDTSSVTDMSRMFSNCYSLQSIPQLNTSSVTTISYMFSNCRLLQTIPHLDTSSVTDMSGMFYSCYSLQSMPQLNTSSVTTMNSMLYDCRSLQSIPPINTKLVTSLYYTFRNCYSLQKLPILDTSSVTNGNNTFTLCYSLQKLQLFNFNTTYSSAVGITDLSLCTMFTKQALVDLFNSLPTNSAGLGRSIKLGSTLQEYLADCYVKDSGQFYTAIMPTNDTSIQSGKTYYTYDIETDTYTQVTPDFSSDTFYYELVTATWNRYDICESTDTGAMLALSYATSVKKYTIT